jgi:hypothetical protein
MTKEFGLYYGDGTFATQKDIQRKRLAEDLGDASRVISRSDGPKPRAFDEWIDVARRQQKDRQELLGIPEFVTTEIETASPILIGLIGDVHSGGTDINYDAFCKDVELIKSVGGYSMALGDLTDSFFFMPEVGEQLFSGDEQVLFMESALDTLAKDDKLIAGWGGDHDMWSKDKSGAHTLYHRFRERYNAHYLEGVSYVDLTLNNGGEQVHYPIIGSHRHKGFSVYNDVHASWRQYNDEAKTDGDILSITAHNHTKGYLRQVRKTFGGREQTIHAISLGTYKVTDRYSRKNGWPRKGDESVSSFGLVLRPEPDKQPEVYWTIQEAINHL